MKNSKANFIIDVLMFVFMFAIAGIGFLMKYILIPGKERWIKYGSNVDLFLFGMDRHEWGTIHLILGLILFGLLALHIILHWGMILSLYHRLIKSQTTRKIATMIFIIICGICLIFPIVAKIEINKHKPGEERHIRRRFDSQKNYHHRTTNTDIKVRGYMTLKEVAEKYNVSIKHLKKHLGITQSTPDEEKLGWLKRKYDFSMEDIEKIIDEYRILKK